MPHRSRAVKHMFKTMSCSRRSWHLVSMLHKSCILGILRLLCFPNVRAVQKCSGLFAQDSEPPNSVVQSFTVQGRVLGGVAGYPRWPTYWNTLSSRRLRLSIMVSAFWRSEVNMSTMYSTASQRIVFWNTHKNAKNPICNSGANSGGTWSSHLRSRCQFQGDFI